MLRILRQALYMFGLGRYRDRGLWLLRNRNTIRVFGVLRYVEYSVYFPYVALV